MTEEDTVPGAEAEDAEAAKPDSEDTATSEDKDGEDAADEGAEGGEEEGEDKSEDEPKPKAKPKGGFQRRISELTANLRKAEREREQLLQRVLDGQQPRQPAQAPQQPPKQEDYTDYAAYLDARTEHLVNQRVESALGQMRTQQSQAAAQTRQQQAMEAYDAKVADARAEYEDFDEVAFSEVPITKDMAQAILESDVGPKVQYHLGSHPEEAQRIARLSPHGQVREIGKLEAKLASPPPKKTTQAGKPIKPVGGQGGAGGSTDPDKLPIEEWMKRANEGTLKYR